MNTAEQIQTAEPTPLRDSAWAMQLFRYTKERRSAFWQFIYSHGIPHIRLGRTIYFSERAVMNYLAKHSSDGRIP